LCKKFWRRKKKKTEVKFDEGDTRERKAENSRLVKRGRLEREEGQRELKDNRVEGDRDRWRWTSCRSFSK